MLRDVVEYVSWFSRRPAKSYFVTWNKCWLLDELRKTFSVDALLERLLVIVPGQNQVKIEILSFHSFVTCVIVGGTITP